MVEEVEEAGEFAAEAEYSSEAARIHFGLRLKVHIYIYIYKIDIIVNIPQMPQGNMFPKYQIFLEHLNTKSSQGWVHF